MQYTASKGCRKSRHVKDFIIYRRGISCLPDEQMEVIVERMDGGGAKDKGSFRCTLCNASIEKAHFKWPEDHVRRRHKGG